MRGVEVANGNALAVVVVRLDMRSLRLSSAEQLTLGWTSDVM